MAKLPVFYDSQQNRWHRSRRAIFLGFVFIASTFVVFGASLVMQPHLPFLNINATEKSARGAAEVVVHQPQGNQLAINFDAHAFTTLQSKIKKPLTQKVSQTKMLGFYVNWDENSFTSLKTNIKSIDVLIPEWLHLAPGGAIVLDDELQTNKTLELIRDKKPDLSIVPLINNFNNETQNWDSNLLRQAIGSDASRQVLVQSLFDFTREHNFSGVSVDFEVVPELEQANLTLFMQLLYAKFHAEGLQVTQSIPLDDDSFNAAELGKYSDFLILMAYDEHSTESTPAGPVASQGWFVQALQNRYKELPPERYIVSIGGYGYDWEEESMDGKETTFGEAMQIASDAKATVVLNTQSLNPTYSYYDADNILHHAWYLDAVSSFNQMQAAQKMGAPYGYALWRLGSEDPSLWNIVPKKDALDAAAATTLESLQYGYDVGYKGDGEILRVTSVPQKGQRQVSYDTASGFITKETISKFPSPYVITRYGGTKNNKIILTFDDGPDETYTPQILDILKRYNVPATFFIMGLNASVHPDIVQRIVAEGNEVGNHTYTHPDIARISTEQFRMELAATERLFEGVLGKKSLLFRPPYAEDIEPTTPEHVAPLAISSELGYYTVGINIDPHDWNRPGADAIVETVVSERKAGVGNVVLMHDSGGDRSQTVEALPRIIEALQADGYQFVTVSEAIGLPMDAVMPPIGVEERNFSYMNKVAFFSVFSFTNFLSLIFFVGIYLGIARFIFVGTLAVVHYFRTKKKVAALYTQSFVPRVVVVIPAFDEEKVIVKTIQSLLTSTYAHFRIVMVDDGSKDKTLAVAREAFAHHPLVTIFTQKNQGKSRALNFGIAQTTEQDEIIVTLDADTVFQSQTIEKLVRRFEDARVAAVAGNAKVGNRINILTRWQALEYITSQNLDRRACDVMNCISVVPGSVGAWRRSAVIEAGGFSMDTLAEDADLTFGIIRLGYQVVYEDEALAFTEAPDTVKSFVNQRFRWMFGTMQTAWKHKDILFRKRYGALGFFAIPNIAIFQVFFTLISPLMDLTLIASLSWAVWQKYQHPVGYDIAQAMQGTLFYYGLFLLVDMTTSLLPFMIERKEQWRLLLLLPLQRFFYRQLMYYVAIKATAAAIKGRFVKWGNIERKATAHSKAMGR